MTLLVALAAIAANGAGPNRLGPLDEVAAGVGKAFGETWTVAPDLATVQISVEYSDIDKESLRRGIAEAVGGLWVRRPNGNLNLEHSTEFRKEYEKEEVRLISRSIANTPSFLNQQSLLGKASVSAKQMAVEIKSKIAMADNRQRIVGPVDCFLADLLRSKGFPKLIPSRPYETVVFSNRPTGAELPISKASLEAFEAFTSICQDMRAFFSPAEYEAWDDDSKLRIFDSIYSSKSFDRFVLMTYRSDTAMFANCGVYDSDGALVAWTSWNAPIRLSSQKSLLNELASPRVQTDLSKKLIEVGTRPEIPVSREIENALQGFDGRDLCSELAAESLRYFTEGLAKARIFVLPDNLGVAQFGKFAATSKDFQSILDSCNYVIESGNGVLLGRPIVRNTMSRSCLDRTSLQNWVARARATSDDSIYSLGRLYRENEPSISSSQLDNWYRDTYFKRFAPRIGAVRVPRWLLLILGSLTQKQIGDLLAGSKVPIGAAPVPRRFATLWSRSGLKAISPIEGSTGISDAMRLGTWSFPVSVPSNSKLSTLKNDQYFFRELKGSVVTDLSMEDLARRLREMNTPATDDAISQSLAGAFDVLSLGGDRFVLELDGRLELVAVQPAGSEVVIGKDLQYKSWPEPVRRSLRAMVAGSE